MREAFERTILEAPDDLANYAAYADWLFERGDPRGEFMQVQLALEDERRSADERAKLRQREQELLAAHQAEWLGPLASLLLSGDTIQRSDYVEGQFTQWEVPNYEWRFARGFLDSVFVRDLSVPMARALRGSQHARFLRRLEIEYVQDVEEPEGERPSPVRSTEGIPELPTFERDNIQFNSIFPLAHTPEFTNLRYLRVGDEKDMDQCLTSRYGIQHHTFCNPAGPLVARMPRLEELHLLCKDFDPVPVFGCSTLTNLRVLRVYHLGCEGTDVWHRGRRSRYEYPLDVLARNPALGNLTHLLFHPHHEEGGGSFLPLEQVRVLLASKRLKRLTHLQLRLSDMGDEGCEVIVSSGSLKRLRWLDLRHGRITDEGARVLAACPDLKNLEHLDLSRNGLTKTGIAALRAAGVPLRADHQQTEQEVADEQYLREGDFE
jgi:uncharacterized protein (TIGR02996 family)